MKGTYVQTNDMTIAAFHPKLDSHSAHTGHSEEVVALQDRCLNAVCAPDAGASILYSGKA